MINMKVRVLDEKGIWGNSIMLIPYYACLWSLRKEC